MFAALNRALEALLCVMLVVLVALAVVLLLLLPGWKAGVGSRGGRSLAATAALLGHRATREVLKGGSVAMEGLGNRDKQAVGGLVV